MTPAEVVEALRSGHPETISAQGDERFRSRVSADQMRQVWADATHRWGELVGVDEPVVTHDLPLRFTSSEAHLQVAYRGDRVVGLMLKPGPPTGRFGD